MWENLKNTTNEFLKKYILIELLDYSFVSANNVLATLEVQRTVFKYIFPMGQIKSNNPIYRVSQIKR